MENSLRGLQAPSCPECGGDMMGFRNPLAPEITILACRACGATFTFDNHYSLQPYFMELTFPACPDCGSDMTSSPHALNSASTTWSCPRCGTTFTS